ncbi:hypothetical protein C8F01DRAFT_1167361, partial [Mycena amicta]
VRLLTLPSSVASSRALPFLPAAFRPAIGGNMPDLMAVIALHLFSSASAALSDSAPRASIHRGISISRLLEPTAVFFENERDELVRRERCCRGRIRSAEVGGCEVVPGFGERADHEQQEVLVVDKAAQDRELLLETTHVDDVSSNIGGVVGDGAIKTTAEREHS